MQAIYYPLSDLRVEEGEEITLISNHDEYSLWFDVSKLPARYISNEKANICASCST